MTENDYLRELAANAGVNNYDDTMNFDGTLSAEQAYDAVEIENFLATAKRKHRGLARNMAEKIVRSPRALFQVKEEMRQSGNAAGFTPATTNAGLNLAAQFDLNIRRQSVNIAADLPVALFGGFDSVSAYTSVISQFLPTGVTLKALSIGNTEVGSGTTSATYKSATSVNFTFAKSGSSDDVVTLTLGQYDYPAFLAALRTSKFTVSNARYNISNTTTGLPQLTKPFKSIERSMFGAYVQNDIPLSSAKTPYQMQNGIVDINGTFKVNAQTSWVLLFGPDVAQEVVVSSFVTQTDKGVI
jgi:hypothetical protein